VTDKPPYQPAIHHRRSIRLRGYDYSLAGAYFITICTHHRESLFGDIVNGAMLLNDPGRMVQTVWGQMPIHYHGIITDEFVVMPNHIHAVAIIVGAGPCACPIISGPRACPIVSGPCACPPRACTDHGQPSEQKPGDPPQGGHPRGKGHPRGGAPTTLSQPDAAGRGGRTLSLPDVVHRWKTMTTRRYADGVTNSGWQPFHGRLWQRNYWEHIIRNETELNRIREYILNNPTQWESDRLHGQAADHEIHEPAAKYGLEPWMVYPQPPQSRRRGRPPCLPDHFRPPCLPTPCLPDRSTRRSRPPCLP
jgi:putative transposase